jgi:hypothetical protein
MLTEVEEATEAKSETAIEARRANDRERKERQRHGKSREVTGQNVTERDNDDTLSPKEISPTPPKEITPFPVHIDRARARSEAFDRFWSVWPNKVGKPVAERAFAKVANEVDAIISGVERYVRDRPPDRDWLNPSTFLNQRRWEDQPAPVFSEHDRQTNSGTKVHAAAQKLCDDVASGVLQFGAAPPPLLAVDRERDRQAPTRLLSQG